MSEHAADLARLRAEADQQKESMRELGATIHAFYDGLRQSGFGDEAALGLTRTYLTEMLRGVPMTSALDQLKDMFGGSDD